MRRSLPLFQGYDLRDWWTRLHNLGVETSILLVTLGKAGYFEHNYGASVSERGEILTGEDSVEFELRVVQLIL